MSTVGQRERARKLRADYQVLHWVVSWHRVLGIVGLILFGLLLLVLILAAFSKEGLKDGAGTAAVVLVLAGAVASLLATGELIKGFLSLVDSCRRSADALERIASKQNSSED